LARLRQGNGRERFGRSTSRTLPAASIDSAISKLRIATSDVRASSPPARRASLSSWITPSLDHADVK
jgi:hypothetical protein